MFLKGYSLSACQYGFDIRSDAWAQFLFLLKLNKEEPCSTGH
jgi:hypothetical protein